jgi:hypothetical protein
MIFLPLTASFSPAGHHRQQYHRQRGALSGSIALPGYVRGKNFFFILVLGTMLLPTEVTIILNMLFSKIG